MVALLVFLGIFWVLPMYIANEQGKAKHRQGLSWGFCFGWLGVLIMAVLPPAQERPKVVRELVPFKGDDSHP